MTGRCALALCAALAIAADAAGTAAAAAVDGPEPDSATAEELLVEYPADFFHRYKPVTALDMIQQVPGFQPDDGTSERGFIAAVGNILINEVYPSAKQDSPSSILARIPADQVAKLELIRGQVRGIDLQGQPAVVNVVLHGDLPAAVRWDLYLRHHSEGPMKPGVDVSVSDRWGAVDYNAGMRMERDANGETGNDRVLDAGGQLLETADVSQDSTGIDLTATFNASTLLGRTLARVNSRAHYETRTPFQISLFEPHAAGAEARRELVGDDLIIKQFELGADGERDLSPDLSGKAIFLYSLEQIPKTSVRRVFDEADFEVSSTIADVDTETTALIGRIELDWDGLPAHNVQFNVEGAYNSVDGSLLQTVDTGDGPVEVDVPGANTLVEEIRTDILLKDTWSLEALTLEFGLGAEASTITQSGDAEQERDFFFLKPELVATYTFGLGQQTRFRAAREVAQLDFDDFITATVFEDDDLSLGNPNLRPDTTWVAALSHEWRFGRDSVVKLTAFHDWISDVLDLLPLSPTFEAPGNIGDGRRWGLELESTMPLDGLGLAGAKLDVLARVQDSTVVDPVTGRRRVLSAEIGGNAYRTLANFNRNLRYFARVDYRQDFADADVAWGWTVAERDKRPLFRVNELDVREEGYAINVFVETTRWRGLKLSLACENLLNYAESRERTIYAGERGLTAVEIVELRERHNGRRTTLSVSGSF